ncbi:MAG: hypothetical protein P4L22_03900, partial [Candidatus Babeliales bacterium]|nr:hypothetical protein [Candidatus Babeliales bacterium]
MMKLNMKRKIIASFIFIQTINIYSVDTQSQTIKAFLQKASAIQIFQKIDSTKIKVFSTDSLIRSGVSQEGFNEWETLTKVANELVNQEIQNDSENFKKYKDYLHSINLVFSFINKSINSLHQKYKDLYVKASDESKKPILKIGSRSFSLDDLKEIKDIVDLSKIHANQMNKINSITFKNLTNGVAIPKPWSNQFYDEKGKIINADEIMDNYKGFLNSYKKQKDFNEFMEINNITNTKVSEQVINKLEQILYVMNEKIKTNKKNKEREENIILVNQIIDKIRESFPKIISGLQGVLFNSTDDKTSMILFAQSGAFESVLNQLHRDAKELYNSAQEAEKIAAVKADADKIIADKIAADKAIADKAAADKAKAAADKIAADKAHADKIAADKIAADKAIADKAAADKSKDAA